MAPKRRGSARAAKKLGIEETIAQVDELVPNDYIEISIPDPTILETGNEVEKPPNKMRRTEKPKVYTHSFSIAYHK